MANQIIEQINIELSELQGELSKFKKTIEYLDGAKNAVQNAVQNVNHSELTFTNKIQELKSTYDSIVGLKETVNSIMSRIDGINFPERLDNIERTVILTIDALEGTKKDTIEKVQSAAEAINNVDFETKFNELKIIVIEVVSICEELTLTINKQNLGTRVTEFESRIAKRIIDSFKGIELNVDANSKEFSKTVSNLNLPSRISKLESSVAELHNSTKNLDKKLELLEKKIFQKLKDSDDLQKLNIFETGKDMNNRIIGLSSVISNLEKTIRENEKNQKIRTFITWFLIAGASLAVAILDKINLKFLL